MGRGVGGGVDDGPLGAVLLVDEGGSVAELREDVGEGVRVGDGGLGLDADLVARGVGDAVVDALVGEGVDAAVLAEAEDLAFGAEVAGGSVVEGVVLEGARGVEVEAEMREAGLEERLDRRRGTLVRSRQPAWGEYTRRMRCKTRALLRFCGFFEAVADGEAKAGRFGERTENDGDAATVEFAQTGEEGMGECGLSSKEFQSEDFDVAMVDGPVLREHDAGFFFVCDQLNEAVVEFGFGVDEDEAGTGGVVADADSGRGEALRFGWVW